MFPHLALNATIPDHAEAITDVFTRDMAVQECTRYSGRRVTDTTLYTTSLCDITQKGFEFLLHDGSIHALDNGEEAWFYILISIGTILLVTALAQNIATMLGHSDTDTNTLLELAVALVLLTTTVVTTSLNNAFVTTADRTYYDFTVVYVVCNLVQWVIREWAHVRTYIIWAPSRETRAHEKDTVNIRTSKGQPVNVLIGTLLATICTVYNGIESEYVLPLLFMLCTQTLCKTASIYEIQFMENTHYNKNDYITTLALDKHTTSQECIATFQISIILDFMLVALTHQYGFRTLFTNQQTGDAYFVILFISAYALSIVITQKHNERQEVTPQQSKR